MTTKEAQARRHELLLELAELLQRRELLRQGQGESQREGEWPVVRVFRGRRRGPIRAADPRRVALRARLRVIQGGRVDA